MKRILILALIFCLTGCILFQTKPIERKFPDIPPELRESCPDLKLVDEKTDKFSEVLKVVTQNYATYHECKIKVDSWKEWHRVQKALFESVK